MALTLYFHPLASFCHKALTALYENGTEFTRELVDLGNSAARAAYLEVWPVGKIPGCAPLGPFLRPIRADADQKIVTDRLRPAGGSDPHGVAEARGGLAVAYDTLERHLEGKTWPAADAFTLADCAAAPALFYAGIVEPFTESHPRTAGYFERLLQRPSFRRVLAEARPWFQYFPYRDAMPARFLAEAAS